MAKPNGDYMDIEFGGMAPAISLGESGEIVGRLVKVELSPDDLPSSKEYGRSPIITFAAIRGSNCTSVDGEAVDIVPGEEYCLWLFGSLLQEEFIVCAPAVAEVFAIRSLGRHASKTRKDKDGSPAGYSLYSVIMPDRPVVEQPDFDWSQWAANRKK